MAEAGGYRLWLEAEVHDSRDVLPGKVRQRIKKLIASLRVEPRPARSLAFDTVSRPKPENKVSPDIHAATTEMTGYYTAPVRRKTSCTLASSSSRLGTAFAEKSTPFTTQAGT